MHAFQSFIEVCLVPDKLVRSLAQENTTKSYYHTCYDQIYDDEHIMSMKTRNKTQQNPIAMHVMLY